MLVRTPKIFFFILVLSCTQVFSQVYYKIPIDTNYFWRQYSTCPNYNYQIKYYTDTTVNGKTYNKYSTFFGEYGPGKCLSFVRNGFLRQDTVAKKVFILDENFNERPLYDFSKIVGDTLQSYDKVLNANTTLTIVNTTTINMNDGTKRKGLWTSDNNCYVEGMGSIFGGLYGNNQPMQSNNKTEQLICFGLKGPFQVLCSGLTTFSLDCTLIPLNVGICENAPVPLNIDIFPIPGQTDQIIQIDNNKISDCQVKLYDLKGMLVRVIFDGKIYQGQTNIRNNVIDLASSIYLYVITLDGQVFTKRTYTNSCHQ